MGRVRLDETCKLYELCDTKPVHNKVALDVSRRPFVHDEGVDRCSRFVCSGAFPHLWSTWRWQCCVLWHEPANGGNVHTTSHAQEEQPSLYSHQRYATVVCRHDAMSSRCLLAWTPPFKCSHQVTAPATLLTCAWYINPPTLNKWLRQTTHTEGSM